jgi:FdhD protein
MNELATSSVKSRVIRKVNTEATTPFTDVISVEEPLEIRISYGSEAERIRKSISVTMRTPGNDLELALGFLFTEGIISSYENIKSVSHAGKGCLSQRKNIVEVEFAEDFVPQLQQSERNFYTTSSCGVCGKSSIQSIKTISTFRDLPQTKLTISPDILYCLKDKLRSAQGGFAATGGIHASGLFSSSGELIAVREDVGRHNALDKLIGNSLMNNALPLNQHILLLSGRASFELIQKAAMAGISLIAAIGAPSSLAVELAEELDITLIGFLKEDSFNIYHQSAATEFIDAD